MTNRPVREQGSNVSKDDPSSIDYISTMIANYLRSTSEGLYSANTNYKVSDDHP